MVERPVPSGIDAITTLQHFSIVTLFVDLAKVKSLIDSRFEPVVVKDRDGIDRGLLSVVPFVDVDFRLVKMPVWKWAFEQTNYRIYVRDSVTGQNAVWFLGTLLNSWTALLPRYGWKLPWHRGKISFDVSYDEQNLKYANYRVESTSEWAPSELIVRDSGVPPEGLIGFSDIDVGLGLLTHPLIGYYFRRDGSVGSYSIWHDRLMPTEGKVERSRFGLLDRLELCDSTDLKSIHSVLLQERTEFTIYLPPEVV